MFSNGFVLGKPQWHVYGMMVIVMAVAACHTRASKTSGPIEMSASVGPEVEAAISKYLDGVSVTPEAEDALNKIAARAVLAIEGYPIEEQTLRLEDALATLEKLSKALRDNASVAEGMTKQELILGTPGVSNTLVDMCPIWPICD